MHTGQPVHGEAPSNIIPAELPIQTHPNSTVPERVTIVTAYSDTNAYTSQLLTRMSPSRQEPQREDLVMC